jgi:hypothetical protein
MELTEHADAWEITELARGLATFVAVLGALALLAFRAASGGWGPPPDLEGPGSNWLVAGIALFALASLLVQRRRWRFDFARREASLERRGLLGPRRRRIPFAELRRVAVPAGATSFGKPVGRLVLFHARGVESFRPHASRSDHAKAASLAERLQARLGLARVEDDAIIQELLANRAMPDAVQAVKLLRATELREARLEVERLAQAAGVRPTGIDLLRLHLREVTLEQLVMLALLMPLILLALLFGKRRR